MTKAKIALCGLALVGAGMMAGAQVTGTGALEIGEEILFDSGDLTLSGSLLLPETAGPHPAVVMLEGSGGYSFRRHWAEDATLPLWRLISDAMVERGFAVLLFDKRGVNRSEGSWRTSTFEDRADDAVAASAYLRDREEIDGTTIGVMGHSQGGWIAQLVAARSPEDVAFVVTLAGPTTTVKEQILDDRESEWRCEGLAESRIARKRGWTKFLLDVNELLSRIVPLGYIGRIVDYDPAETLRRITQPMLAIFGGTDRLVWAEKNVELLKAAFEESGNTQLIIHTIPGAGHGLQPYEPCSAGGASDFAPGFLDALLDPSFYECLGI